MNVHQLHSIADLERQRTMWAIRAQETDSRLLASVYRRKAADLELEIARQSLLNAARKVLAS